MIVDTNALSDYLEGVRDVVSLLDRQLSVEIPVVVLGEYRFGLLGSTRRTQLGVSLAAFLNDTTVLPLIETTADFYALIRMGLRMRGKPIPANDIWIAALARQYGLPILSQDAHFDLVDGVERVGW